MKTKQKILAGCIAAAAVIGGVLIWRGAGGDSGTDDVNTAYVEQVSVLTGTGTVGMVNRFAGVIEAQETWSVQLNPEGTVQEVFVEEGEEVKKGDPLFRYSTDKYQSDLSQANIDLQRLQNEAATIDETIAQLEAEKAKASASEQANYTIQIQEQNLNKQQKQLDIQSKQIDIDKLNSNISNATVKSEMSGVVQSISDSSNTSDSSSAYITVMSTGDVRVKGTVNEQNISSIIEGESVIVYSRRDDSTWTGTVAQIDTAKTETSQNSSYYGSSDAGSSSYPFYVNLDSSDGLMIGQHVYLEPDYGQGEETDSDALYLPEYYIDLTDEENPFVWAEDQNGKLEKRSVALGEMNEFYEYEVLEGLTEEDSIAFPSDELKEGMKTLPMSEMPDDYYTTVYGDSSYETEDGENTDEWDSEEILTGSDLQDGEDGEA